jgi:ABC-type Zn uptake system ZnuABC Zn-binding protein ZnuA
MYKYFTLGSKHINGLSSAKPVKTLLTLMFNLGLSLSLSLLISSTASANSDISTSPASEVKKTVTTVIPVAHSLLMQLLANTTIVINYLPPKRLPINRLSSWVAKHVSKKQPSTTAVVGIDAMRPALSFYTALRKENIHAVNIDIAKALMPGGEQVAIYQQNRQGYFWLNLNNALVMTGILRRDLTALWPTQAVKINANAANISQQLRLLSMQLDDELFDKNIEQLVVAQPALADFAASFPLPIVTLKEAKANGLKTLLIHRLKSKAPSVSANITPWAIDDFSKTSKLPFTKRWLKTAKSMQ